MATENEQQAAYKLRELGGALKGYNRCKTDVEMDEMRDRISTLWIEVYNALVTIDFQPPADLRRVARREAGTAWLEAISKELEGRETA